MTQISAEVSKLAPKLSENLKTNQKKQAVNNLVASLFNTVRMSEWAFDSKLNTFKFPLSKKLSLILTPTSVEVRKGIRTYPIGNGKDAGRLFDNIKHAQAVIAKAVAEQDVQVKHFMEAFDIEELDRELASGDNDNAITADIEKVDIKIKDAPDSVPAAVADPIAEEAVKGLGGIGFKDDDGTTVTFDDDAPDGDLFAEALDNPTKADPLLAMLGSEENYGPQSPKRSLTADAVAQQAKINLQSLEGRVLTIVESAFADKEQRTAVKTLVKKEFRRTMDKL